MGWSGWFAILQAPGDCSKVKASNKDQLQYSSTTKRWELVTTGELGATDFLYFGDPTTNGTWRIGRSGDNLVFQRRESGAYVTKGSMKP